SPPALPSKLGDTAQREAAYYLLGSLCFLPFLVGKRSASSQNFVYLFGQKVLNGFQLAIQNSILKRNLGCNFSRVPARSFRSNSSTTFRRGNSPFLRG
ncbi:hypothetical protein, partial [Celeribacter halophilus]|uniref:hypothetical protein n=1 Tax=Celeribacter halophilus TaxID=576117 RepID=UPI001C09E791